MDTSAQEDATSVAETELCGQYQRAAEIGLVLASNWPHKAPNNIIIFPPSDRRSDFSFYPCFLLGGIVIPEESDRRRVVVKLRKINAELFDHVSRAGEDERWAIGLKELVKAATDAVVIEGRKLRGRKSQEVRHILARPFAHAVDRLTGDEVVFEEHERADNRLDGAALVLDHELAQEIFDLGAIDEAFEDGQCADIESSEGLVAGLRNAADIPGTIFVRPSFLHAREVTSGAWNVNVPNILKLTYDKSKSPRS